MSDERFREVMAVFKEACLLDDAARSFFLEERCREDADLRHQVDAMFVADQQGGPVDGAGGGMHALARELGQPAGAEGTSAAKSSSADVAILAGNYKILRVVGEGGMGTVYEAEQSFPRRIVALKAIRRGLASRQMLRRFENEAHILGRLHHPGIAQIYEAGAPDPQNADQAYIAMEFVRGLPLTKYSAERRLSIPQRLELIARVADAVHHAHLRGIIHRDLKPNNILVIEEQDSAGQPKVLDFGVARAVGADRDLQTMHTVTGQLLGTLPYMSPEQVAGDPDEVDARADVYAIGLMLFEVLTGRLPYDISQQPLAEAVRLIRETPPPSLSVVNRALRGDVETIVARAIEKDRERRYSSAADLAEDLRRYLRGEPIAARRDSAMYLLRKNLSRYRGAVAAAALLITMLAAFGVRTFMQARENRMLAAEALQQKQRADVESVKLRRTLYLNRIGFAQAALENRNSDRFLRLLDACPAELRGWEWRYLRRMSDRSTSTTRGPGMIVSLGASADGRRFIVQYPLGVLEVYEADRNEPVRTIRDAGGVTRFDLSADGSRVVIADGEGRISVRSMEDGHEQAAWRVALPEGRTGVPDVRFSGDGRIVALGQLDGPIILFDTQTGDEIRTLAGHTNAVTAMGFLPDGSLLASGSLDITVRIWDVASGACRHVISAHALPVRALAVSPSQPRVLTGGADGMVKEWNTETGKLVRASRPHEGGVLAVAYSPDDTSLVSAGADQALYLQSDPAPRESTRLTGHTADVTALAFVGQPPVLLSGSRNGELKRWDWPLPDEPRVHDCDQNYVSAMALSPDGRWVATGGGNGLLKVWDARTLEMRFESPAHRQMIQTIVWSPDGRRIASAGFDQAVQVRDADSGAMHAEIGGFARLVYDVAYSPDGRMLVSADGTGEVRVFDAERGGELFKLGTHRVEARAVAFHPRGGMLISAARDGSVKVWDVAARRETKQFKAHGDAIVAVAFSPDGSHFATASADATAAVWESASCGRVSQCRGHIGLVRCVTFNADGTRLVTGGMDRTIRIWDILNGEEYLTLKGHAGHVDKLTFTADGAKLISCSGDDTIRIWDAGIENRLERFSPAE